MFRFDLRATRLGTLDLALTPTRTAGATVLFGQSDQHPPSLLAPLRGPDGNCRRPDPNNAAEVAAWRAYQALKPLTQDDTGNHGRGLLADVERAARG